MTVTNGGWAAGREDGIHNIFWLVRGVNKDMIGYVNVKGPDENTLFARHGINQKHSKKAKLVKRFVWPEGDTYTFDYRYDTLAMKAQLRVFDKTGKRLLVIEDRPNAQAILISESNAIIIDLGFTGTDNPNEPASIDWIYRDLELDVYE